MTYAERRSQSRKPKAANKPTELSAPPASRSAGSKGVRLVFFGNERLATGLPPIEPIVLPALIEAGYDVAAVVSNYTAGQSRSARELEVAAIAEKHGIPLLLPTKTVDILDQLKAYGAEAAVLVAYGRIVPSSVIDIFPKGIINLHPSLLPAYRGPTPLEQTILDGLTETGVSLMSLAPEMDAGPVFAQAKVKLSGEETKTKLASLMLEAGCKVLLEKLPDILNGALSPQQQDESQATYTKLLNKADGLTNFEESAPVIARKVRAYAGFPKLRAELNNHEVVITKAKALDEPAEGGFIIECQPGYLDIQELIAPSGKLMSGADFLRGYKL